MAGHLDWDSLTPQQLYDMLMDGKTYSQIAALYGVSRNTVSGTVYRWRNASKFPANLPSFSNAAKPKSGSKILKQPRKVRQKTNINLPKPAPEGFDPDAEAERPPEIKPPTNDPVSILDLEFDMCAVVVSTDPVMYCGCKPLKNHTFRMCAYHAAGMVADASDRRKARKLARRLHRR